jgi:cbb3-type cytochrome oxidase subunit 3
MTLLLIICTLALIFIAMQTRPAGAPAVRRGFLYALGAVFLLGVVLAVVGYALGAADG